MKSLTQRIAEANHLLAPYAVPIEGTLGRSVNESPDATRFPFQRDRDRIVHCLAFRRLKGKTQVFVSGGGDHYRTRLTHTFEVAQISRDMARTLRLNEDLAECIALAHDLGHPPFGHAGEEALDTWMRTHGGTFEHNRQSLRVVSVLETHSALQHGLNLNLEVLEGLMKHRTPFDNAGAVTEEREGIEEIEGIRMPRRPSLEAQLVNLADEIAYTGHDVDDGLRAKLFSVDDVRSIPLTKEALGKAHARGTSLRGALIDLLVSDVYVQTDTQIVLQGVASLDDVYTRADQPVRFSPAMREKLDALRAFLWKRMYLHPDVIEKARNGQHIVRSLCDHFFAHPTEKIVVLMNAHSATLPEAVKDYVAGMTDDFAKQSQTE